MPTLGSLVLNLEVNDKNYKAGLAKAKTEASKVAAEISKILTSFHSVELSPKVNHKELKKLNEHLDLKQKHLKDVQKYFSSNPLTPKVDTKELADLERRLKALSSGTVQVNVKASGNVSSARIEERRIVVNIDTRGIERVLEKHLAKPSKISSAIGSIATAPFKLVGSTIGAIVRGSLENIGAPIGKDIGEGIRDGVEKELGTLIGSFKLVGRNLGKGLTEELKDALDEDLDTLQVISNELFGRVNLVRESAAVRNRQSKNNQETSRQASEQVSKEFDFATQNIPRIRSRGEELKKLRSELETKAANLQNKIKEQASKLGVGRLESKLEAIVNERNELLEKITNELESEAPDQTKLDFLNKSLNNLSRQYDNVSRSIEELDKIAAEQFRDLADKLQEKFEDLRKQERRFAKLVAPFEEIDLVEPIKEELKQKTQNTNLKNVSSTYKTIFDEVAKASGITPERSQIPMLEAANLPKSVNAAYLANSNKIQVSPELLAALESNTLTTKQLETLIHELRHAFQFDFGKNVGTETIAVEALTPSKKEARRLGNRIENSVRDGGQAHSEEFRRRIEADAYTFAARNVENISKTLEKKQSVDAFNSEVGIGGGILYKKFTDAEKLALGKLQSIASEANIDISDEVTATLKYIEQIKAEFESELDRIDDLDTLPVEEIKALQESLKASLDASIKELFLVTKDFKDEVANKPAKIQEIVNSSLPQLNRKKELIPIAEKLGIQNASELSKKELINEISRSERLNEAYPLVFERTRERAQRDFARRERLSYLAAQAGAGAREALEAGKGILSSPVVQNTLSTVGGSLQTGLGIAGGIARTGYQLASGVEGLTLSMIPGGKIAKGALQQTVVPAALYGAATHMLPGGQAVGAGLEHLMSAALSPLGDAATSSALSHTLDLVNQLVPKTFGLQTHIAGQLTGLIQGAGGMITEAATAGLTAILGGKAIQAGVSQITPELPALNIPLALPSAQKELDLLPVSEPLSLPAAKANSSAASNSAITVLGSTLSGSSSVEGAKEKIENTVANIRLSTEDAIQKTRDLAGALGSLYKSMKEALTSGDIEKAVKFAKEVKEYSVKIGQEIKATRSQLGSEAKMGTPVGNKINQTLSMTSRYRNEAQRIIDISASRIDDDALLSTEDIQEEVEKIRENLIRSISKAGETVDVGDLSEVLENLISDISSKLSDATEDFSFEEFQAELENISETVETSLGNDALYSMDDVRKAIQELKANLIANVQSLSQSPGEQANQAEIKAANAEASAERAFANFAKAENEIENKINKANSELEKTLATLGENEESLGSRIQRIIKSGSFPEAIAGIKDLGNSAIGLVKAFGAFTGLSIVVPILGSIAQATTNVAQEFQKLEAVINFTSGSVAEGAKNLDFIRSTVKGLSGDLRSGMEGFKTISAATIGTTFTNEQTQNIFSAVQQAGTVYQLDPVAQERAFLAIGQMMSKGNVQAEELRGQLGEALPGAFNIAAKAMGVTTKELNKMLELGQVIATDFLPKFAAQLSADTKAGLPGALKTTQASINNLNTAITELQVGVGKELLPVKQMGLEILTKGVQALSVAAPFLGKALAGLTVIAGGSLLSAIAKLASVFIAAKGGLLVFGKVLLGFAAPFAAKIAVFTALTDAVTVFFNLFENRAGKMKELANDARASTEAYRKALEDMRGIPAADSTNRTLVTNVKELAGSSYSENTFIGSLFPKEALREFERDVINFLDSIEERFKKLRELNPFVKAGVDAAINMFAPVARLGMDIGERLGWDIKTASEKAQEDSKLAFEELMNEIQATIDNADLQIDILNPESFLDDYKIVEEKLKELAILRANATAKGDQAELDKIAMREAPLLKEREEILKGVSALRTDTDKKLEMARAALEETKAQLDAGNLTDTEFKRREKELLRQISKLEKQQGEINKITGVIVDNFKRLSQSIAVASAQFQDFKNQFELQSTLEQAAINERAARGEITVGAAESIQSAAMQEQIMRQIQANQQQIAKLTQLLSDGSLQQQLRLAGLENAGAAETRARAEAIDEKTAPATKDALTAAANARQEIEQLQLNTAQLYSQVSQERAQAAERLRDLAKSVAEFYRSIQEQTEDLAIDTAQTNLNNSFTRAKTKLLSSIQGFSDSFFNDFITGFTDLLEKLKEPLMNNIEAARQTLEANRQMQETIRGGSELNRSILDAQAGSGYSGGISGSVTRFEGVRVTSARDASGEPGLDYVVSNGRRGAPFGAVAAGVVVETITDQNWENNMGPGESGSYRGRRGYGNRVIVRARDEVTGEFIDMLYAHLDSVAVQVGQQVGIGTTLGTQGRTGSTTGAHVSLDFFGAGTRRATRASLAMRDRISAQLRRDGGASLNNQIQVPQQPQMPVQQAIPQQPTGSRYVPRGGVLGRAERVRSDPEGARALVDAARRLQLPVDQFVALMSWESGGTLNPNVMGGDGNQYQGLIQFSPDNRATYGIRPNQTIAEQMPAIERYLIDRGFRPGQHDIRHAYSAILSGRADEAYWNRRDSNGTTVRNAAHRFSHGPHHDRAQQFLRDSGIIPGGNAPTNTTNAQGVSGNPLPALPGIPQVNFDQARNNFGQQTRNIQETLAANNGLVREETRIQVNNLTRSLEQTSREITDYSRNILRQQQDTISEMGRPLQELLNPSQQEEIYRREFERQSVEIRRQYEDRSTDLQRYIERVTNGLEDLKNYQKALAQLAEENPELREQISQVMPKLDQNIRETEANLTNLRGMAIAERKLLDQRLQDLTEYYEKEKELRERNRIRQAQQQQNEFRGTLLDNEFSIASEQVSILNSRGLGRQARAIEEDIARASIKRETDTAIANINARVNLEANDPLKLSRENADALIASLQQLNEIRLEAVGEQFSLLNEVMNPVQNSFKTFFSDILSGSKSLGEALTGLFDSILQSLANLASELLVSEIFAMFTGGGGGVSSGIGAFANKDFSGIGGGGGGGGLSGIGGFMNIASTIIGLFNDGGIVTPQPSQNDLRKGNNPIARALQKEGPNSVLAALSPNERVLSARQNAAFEAYGLHKVFNFREGGRVGSAAQSVAFNAPARSTNINIPIEFKDRGADDVNQDLLKDRLRSVVLREIQDQSRPGGLLSKK